MTWWIFDQKVVKYMHNVKKLYLWTEEDASLTVAETCVPFWFIFDI